MVMSSFQLLGQNTYYISNRGNDSNDGLSSQTPWKTISKLNSVNFRPGDNILFNSGDIWTAQSLKISSSGNSDNPIVYSTYGSGEKPIIDARTLLPNWQDESSWKELEIPNVWRMNLDHDSRISRLWLNGIEAKMAYDFKLQSYTPHKLQKGDNGDGTIGVCPTHQFFSNKSQNYFYIYSPINPALYYKEILIPGSIINGKTQKTTVDIVGDYIEFKNLDIRGSMYTSIGLSGADYVLIDNCNIGKYSNWSGIIGDRRTEVDKTSDYITISNCVVDSDWEYKYVFYTQETPWGVAMANGANHWEVKNNLIVDWWMSVDVIAKEDDCKYLYIHNNEITGPRNTFSKAIQTAAGGDWGTSSETMVHFYNNYIHDVVFGVQVSSSNNYFYFNIFENLTLTSVNEHALNAGGWGSQVISGDINTKNSNNYFINNTFYNLNHWGQNYTGWNDSYINNLYINCGILRNGTATRVVENGSTTWKNNLFYNRDISNTFKPIYLYNVGSLTADEFNSLNRKSSNSNIVSGNLQFSGSQSSLIDDNTFILADNSLGINTGADVSYFLPEGFKDRNGNLVDRKSPNIGALSGIKIAEPIDSSDDKSNLKVMLEGAYNNNNMNMSAQLNVPESQPYSKSTWEYTGNESFSVAPTNLIDWVLIELRTSLDNSSYKFAALLLNNGKIVNINGFEDFSENNITDGNYYVIVYHRNHLPIISSQKIEISGSQIQYDFSDSQSKVQGTNSMKELSVGVFGMYSGDSDGNGVINNLDFGNVANNIFSSNYANGDLDMNGIINVLDYSKINSNIFKKSFVPKSSSN